MTDTPDGEEVEAVLAPDIIPPGTIFHDPEEEQEEVNP